MPFPAAGTVSLMPLPPAADDPKGADVPLGADVSLGADGGLAKTLVKLRAGVPVEPRAEPLARLLSARAAAAPDRYGAPPELVPIGELLAGVGPLAPLVAAGPAANRARARAAAAAAGRSVLGSGAATGGALVPSEL